MLTTLLTIALWIFIALAAIYLIFWVDMAIVFFVSFIKHKKEMKQIRMYSAVVANEDACSCQNNINNLRKNNKCYLSFGYKRFPERSNAVLQVVIHKDYTIVEMKRHATPVEENESGLIFLGTGRADDDFILSQAEKFLGGNYLV